MKKILLCMLALALVFTQTACKKKDQEQTVQEIAEMYASDHNTAAWKMLAEMSLQEKIYQLFFVSPESLSEAAGEAGDALKEALAAKPVGGILYNKGNFESKDQVTEMLSKTNGYSRVPLFFGVNEEGGSASQLGAIEGMGVTAYPSMREIGDGGDAAKAREIGTTLGNELKALGFNVNFAPVADVSVGENPMIGTRSFGTDAAVVSDMVKQEVEGLRETGMASVLKHFPGQGGVELAAHSSRIMNTRTYEEMQTAELIPFNAGIMAGTDFVLVSTMVNASITKTNMECCMSTNVMTNILRNTMGFPNIIITDSLSAKTITGYYSAGAAALTAFEAGADMLLLPADMDAAYNAINGAVKSGKITEMRINESVSRILKVKLERGII